MATTATDVIVRFECPREDRVSREYRFDFVQLTYEDLRVGPEGDTFAYFDRESQDWWFSTDAHGRPVETTVDVPRDELEAPWSDIIIHGVHDDGPEPEPSGRAVAAVANAHRAHDPLHQREHALA